MQSSENQTIEESLSAWMAQCFSTAFPDLDLAGLPLYAVASTDDRFGDYQCNGAMALAKQAGIKPRDVAAKVRETATLPDAVERIEIAGPGFINITLRDAWLVERLCATHADGSLGVTRPGEGQTILIDYSSPNVAKPMHIGHIRSTVIGNALDRLFRRLGYRVVADNHLGDWGTQFGLLIMGYRHFVDQAALEASPVEELERIYVKSYERSEQEPGWRDAAKRELVKLQQGDPDNRALWERFIALSMGEFERVYQRLGVRFDLYRGESHYNDRLAPLVDELLAKGLATESEGALVVQLEEEKLPLVIVRKSDGGFNYATTDLATVESRIEEFSPTRIVYVTDERQQLHFKQVFAVCRRLGFQADLVHVWFGLMRLPEATFSTRQGNVIKLERLLDEAEQRAFALVRESSPDMPEDQQREIARAVGIGSVKYADLSQNPQSLVTFTWEKALALDGNSAPYLQYAHARIRSVADKYRAQFPGGDPEAHPLQLGHPLERKLAVTLARYGEVVIKAAQQYRPNLLADYLYDLAQTYSSFYQNVPFLKAEEGVRESRVRLCGMVARTLADGLGLLGIEAPERI